MKNKSPLTFSILFAVANLFSQGQKGAAPISSAEQKKAGNTYAVVIGISDYQDKDIPDLRFADKDAEAFANFLRSNAGGNLDNDHLKVLLNEKATVAQFAIALDWLMEVVKEQDKVIIYFSGHGDVEKKTITQPGYLLCWDAPARVYLAGGALALPMFQDIISTLSTQNKAKVVVITDACRSGKLAGSTVGGSQITGANLAKQYANEIKILSCQPNEYSIEGEQWGGGRGAFSYHLIDALYGMADNNNDLIVNLQEAGRYIEDHVSAEVAPVSQVPMVLGNRTDALSFVDSKMLASLKSGKLNQTTILSSIDSRGMEEDVLSMVDTSIRIIYKLFNQALKDKVFLEPANACADSYYEKLIKEPKLERLHSTLKRNYAAALQDDAQQVINHYMKAEIQEIGLSQKAKVEKYHDYPRQLARAVELLGPKHYLYKLLQARRAYFEGFPLAYSGSFDRVYQEKALVYFQEALNWQPDMPLALLGVQGVYGNGFLIADSAEIYAHRAATTAPLWPLPYVRMAEMFSENFGQFDKAKVYLDLAQGIDSTSVVLWGAQASYYFDQKKYLQAEPILRKILGSSSSAVCHSCFVNLLGRVLLESGRTGEAEELIQNLLERDPTDFHSHTTLGRIYVQEGRYDAAKQEFRLAADLTYLTAKADAVYYYWMAFLYGKQNLMDLAFDAIEQSLQAGMDDFQWMQQDPDLAPLHAQTERWKTLMKKYFPLAPLGDKIKD